MKKRILSLFLTAALLCWVLCGCGGGTDAQQAARKTANYYDSPALSLADSLLAVCFSREENGYTGWQESYYAAVCEELTVCGGVLSETKATDYTQAILGLTAAGYDAQNVAGYDLTAFLSDLEAVQRQGLNAVFQALLALDCGNYEIPEKQDGKTATRDDYLAVILAAQLPDGGFTLGGESGDPDMTAMALLALAPYRDRPEVQAAVDAALACLSALQEDDGGYQSWGTVNSESCAQVILALCQLGISQGDSRFVKNGHTILDKLLTYRQRNGSFAHQEGGDTDSLATLQAFEALTALCKQEAGGPGLFDFSE
ncbi:MAG: prenyltransferase/squalene oxidase repeat-containing protein [Oscillospiraceae bacterium]|nr:prenyltransferase/squalene oxidase repeat-containing protein [Oscillospiraceae bacterium]